VSFFLVPSGAAGPPGTDGADGADGADGVDGVDGVDGADGNSFAVGATVALPSGPLVVGTPGSVLFLSTVVGADPNGMSNGTGLTIPEAGRWLIVAQAYYSGANDALGRHVEVNSNLQGLLNQDFRTAPTAASSSLPTTPRCAFVAQLAAGEQISLRAFFNTGVGTTVIGTANEEGTHLSAHRVA
jgi:hypothetical protein